MDSINSLTFYVANLTNFTVKSLDMVMLPVGSVGFLEWARTGPKPGSAVYVYKPRANTQM